MIDGSELVSCIRASGKYYCCWLDCMIHQIILFLLPVSALQQLRLIPREQQKLENMC